MSSLLHSIESIQNILDPVFESVSSTANTSLGIVPKNGKNHHHTSFDVDNLVHYSMNGSMRPVLPTAAQLMGNDPSINVPMPNRTGGVGYSKGPLGGLNGLPRPADDTVSSGYDVHSVFDPSGAGFDLNDSSLMPSQRAEPEVPASVLTTIGGSHIKDPDPMCQYKF